MRFLACGVLVALAACTSPNPKSCLDGSCTDPRYPFCDENAVFADEPKTCVAVSCSAGDVAECRGNVAVTCNADGNNFDLIACPNGCDASGCMAAPACTTNVDCVTATAPICDTAANACHGCVAHEDCDSDICNADGSCEPASNVVFASPTGDAGAPCTKAEPCTLTRALQVEVNNSSKVMRMLPGTYSEAFLVNAPTGGMVRVVATGAILGTASRFDVSGGAKVHVEDLEVRVASSGSGGTSSCNGAGANGGFSTLELVRMKFVFPLTTTGLHVGRCILSLDRVDFDSQATFPISAGSSSIAADRIHIHGRNGMTFNTAGTLQNIRVTNSFFEGVSPSFTASDANADVSQFRFAFNTFVLTDNNDYFVCPSPSESGNKIIRVENNVIVALGTQSTAVFNSQTCMPTATNPMNFLGHNVIFPFTGTTGTNIVADPKFVNAVAKDFRIQATSPAHDAAVPTAELTTNHDYVGAARTGTLDIGAYELP